MRWLILLILLTSLLLGPAGCQRQVLEFAVELDARDSATQSVTEHVVHPGVYRVALQEADGQLCKLTDVAVQAERDDVLGFEVDDDGVLWATHDGTRQTIEAPIDVEYVVWVSLIDERPWAWLLADAPSEELSEAFGDFIVVVGYFAAVFGAALGSNGPDSGFDALGQALP
ncbi:MAG: hypothetical protein AAGI46_06950 [Planctomycetota bacterium]